MKATKGGRQQCLNTKCLETKGAHPKVTKRRVNQKGKEGKQPTRGYLESTQGGVWFTHLWESNQGGGDLVNRAKQVHRGEVVLV